MQVTISTAPTRYNINWAEQTLDWVDFAERCASPVITPETAEEFRNADSKRQADIKDVGGFVGGRLKDGKRRTGSVVCRTLITLDYDHAPAVPMDEQPALAALALQGWAGLVYTTHSHTAEAPRFRVVIPLSRPLPPKQYEAVARAVAETLGTEGIDTTTYDAERLFFWPSASTGAPFYFDRYVGDFLNPEPYLATIPSEADVLEPSAAMADEYTSNDPRAKGGFIGAFCRAYTISEAIEKYLPDVYTRRGANRYTYNNGTTAGGMVVYDDLWADSHHDSDPAGGHAICAFDLVRCHLVGGSPLNPEKQYIDKMIQIIKDDPKVIAELTADDRTEVATLADSPDAPKPKRRKKELPAGYYEDTIRGATDAILAHLGDHLWYNEFSRAIMVEGGLPWRPDATDWQDRDNHGLRLFLEAKGIKKETNVNSGLQNALLGRSRHPIKEYLDKCRKVPYKAGDLERLFINFLGAEDTPYTRAVTKIFFVGAVARIYDSGCKFDYCPVLQGPQGIGKSTVFSVMGGPWFSDSLSTTEGKDGMEQLRGKWVLEMGELSAMRRSDVEATKAFISRRTDTYRAAYARTIDDWPRQCVIGATTNQQFYLKGDSNRRFLPILVDGARRILSPFEDLAPRRDALWAEALALYEAGTKLYLEAELETVARQKQEAANEDADNPYVADLEVYIGKLLPEDWDKRDLAQRRQYFTGADLGEYQRQQPRMRISPREFLWEYYGIKPADPFYKVKTNGVAKALQMLGWKNVGTSRHCQKAYGRQQSFERPASAAAELEDDEL
jgi:hypothetical protein